jgi:hypothetical protein
MLLAGVSGNVDNRAMSPTNGDINRFSDTAFMVAASRPLETDSEDGFVPDPFAARLAGERGMAIPARSRTRNASDSECGAGSSMNCYWRRCHPRGFRRFSAWGAGDRSNSVIICCARWTSSEMASSRAS